MTRKISERRRRQEERRQERIRQELERQAELYRATTQKPLAAAIGSAIARGQLGRKPTKR